MAPSAMNEDGTCPQCGREAQVASIHGKVTAKNLDLKQLARAGANSDDVSVPWHFKLLIGALAIYLTWRVIQLFS
ncbi:MAG: hypothetical protein ABIU98_08030 [Ilumatobacteraceae bacterium]